MKQIIDRKVYDTDTATELCSDEYQEDTVNRLNRGRATTLYRTRKGAFFFHCETCWQGESSRIVPCEKGEAVDFYERANIIQLVFTEAFPDVVLEDA